MTYHTKVFKKWQHHFSKWYDSIEDEANRFVIFIENWRYIHNHNKNSGASYILGLNEFADLTSNQFRLRVHGHTGSCMSHARQTRISPTTNASQTYYDPSLAIVRVPTSVDWTSKGKVTPVKNQGPCGSCWAFSTTGAIESRYAIKNNKLISLSEQELVDCSKSYGNGGCSGGLMTAAFKYVKDNGGLCSEAEYPYIAKDQPTCRKSSCRTKYDAISEYTNVTPRNEAALLAAVAQGPVSIAIEADENAFQFYSGGVLKGVCGAKLDHGVLVVGYGTDPDLGDYWKVKNSWGSTWGEGGYIRICRNCGKNGDHGECGILDSPSYPNM